MIHRRSFLSATALMLATLATSSARAATGGRPKIVATFSILGDMVSQIAGDDIDLTTLVGPDGDPHVYQPTPSDARALAEADVLFVNGLGYEGWLDRLIAASGFSGVTVVATAGITPIGFTDEPSDPAEDKHDDDDDHDHDDDHGHGSFDPHAWQSLANARSYASNIADGLATADPARREQVIAGRDAYLERITETEAEVIALIAALPASRRTVVTSHDAFQYFGHAYDLQFVAPQGMSTDSEASAADVAALIRQIRAQQIPAVFIESITDRRLLDQIVRETGAVIGGALYADALSGPDGPAPTYLDMIRHNARSLAGALAS